MEKNKVELSKSQFTKVKAKDVPFSQKIRILEQNVEVLKSKVERRLLKCSLLRKNIVLVNQIYDSIKIFLKEVKEPVVDKEEYKAEVIKNLKIHSEFSDKLSEFLTSGQDENILGILFGVFKESIEQTNKDKKYWIEQLKTQNEIVESLGDYLKELDDILDDTDDKEEDDEGRPINFAANHKVLGLARFKLKRAVNLLDFSLSTVETAFENYDQKTNQLMNILSTVLKSTKEMGASVSRNIT